MLGIMQIPYQERGIMNSRLAGLLVFLAFSAASAGYGADLCREYSEKGQYEQAIAACTAIISSSGSKAPSAYDDRGFAFSKVGRYGDAITDFTKAIELNPNDITAYNGRSFAYSRTGQHDKAIADAERAIDLGPEKALAYQSRAVAYEGKKEYDKAIADWGKAIELSPAEYNILSRARLYRNSGQYYKAIGDYTRLIKLNPNKPAGYWFRAPAFYELGLFTDAVKDYSILIEIHEKDYRDQKLDLLYIRLLNAGGKLSRGEYDNVLKELRAYVSSVDVSSDDEKWWRTISKYYLGMDGLSDGKLLEEARKGRNEQARLSRLCDAYYAIGEKRLIEGNRAAAKESFTKSVETGLSSFSHRFAKAMLTLMQDGRI
jgi:tetratricopeptide (TPR) repeat protein